MCADGVKLTALRGAANHGLGARIFNSIRQIARGQHLNARDHDGTDPHGTNHRDLPLGDAWHHDDDPVTFNDAGPAQNVAKPPGSQRDIGKSQGAHDTSRIFGNQRRTIARLGPRVDNINRKVERLGNLPAKPAAQILVTGVARDSKWHIDAHRGIPLQLGPWRMVRTYCERAI